MAAENKILARKSRTSGVYERGFLGEYTIVHRSDGLLALWGGDGWGGSYLAAAPARNE